MTQWSIRRSTRDVSGTPPWRWGRAALTSHAAGSALRVERIWRLGPGCGALCLNCQIQKLHETQAVASGPLVPAFAQEFVAGRIQMSEVDRHAKIG